MHLPVQQRLPRRPPEALGRSPARQHVARNTIALYYVATAYQAADYMTKAVSGEGMKRRNAILFGQDLTEWDNNKDMKKEESRYLFPGAPIKPKPGKTAPHQ